MTAKDLNLLGVISFDGLVRNGLRLHKAQEHILYPMGSKVVIRNVKSAQQHYLTGHRNAICALCVSPCGKFIASGQAIHHGFKATVIIWDYQEQKIKNSYEIHKVRVESLCFTCDSNYLISLGGRDDGCLLVWDVHNAEALCGSFASNEIAGNAYSVCAANTYGNCFVSIGEGTFRIWRFNTESRKLYGSDVKFGKLKRTINCVAIDEKDEIAYCGTTTGDIIKARLHFCEKEESLSSSVLIGCYSKIPRKTKREISLGPDLYSGGIRNLILLPSGKIIIGTGDGTVELIEIISTHRMDAKMKKSPIYPCISTQRAVNVCGAVTSMNLYKDRYILVGTELCEIYEIDLSDFFIRTLVTCHTDSIRDIAFPRNTSEIFATASKNDIRLWRSNTQKELLRIGVPNFICTSLCFDDISQNILSAWNDGMIRGFALAGGKLVFMIHNAHTKAVSSIVCSYDGTKLFSGGCDGQIKVWDAKSVAHRLLCTFKEHKGPITCLRMSQDDKYLISSSTDGTCVLWDTTHLTRKHVLMGNTMYTAAIFIPNCVQVLTCGTDRKIAYWEVWDGSLAREVVGSISASLNCIDVSPDGRYFVTGTSDSIVKFWDYRTANTVCVGSAHAAAITACAFSPDSKYIVTVSSDGAIIIWDYPQDTETSENTDEISIALEKNFIAADESKMPVLATSAEKLPTEAPDSIAKCQRVGSSQSAPINKKIQLSCKCLESKKIKRPSTK